MKVKKVVVTIRVNKQVDAWFKEQAKTMDMNKSELMRKVLTFYKEQHDS